MARKETHITRKGYCPSAIDAARVPAETLGSKQSWSLNDTFGVSGGGSM